MKTILPVILTCSSRARMLETTLSNLAQTDWPIDPMVCLDRETCERPQERQERTAHRALQEAAAVKPEWILFLEDDLAFNRFLFHNVQNWEPFQQNKFGMGSLYNPNVGERIADCSQSWFIANPEKVYGSQAYLFSLECALYVIEHWWEVPGMQDIKMSRLAARHGKPIYYHTPSLVQHIGDVSAWGSNYFHTARDYNEQYKA